MQITRFFVALKKKTYAFRWTNQKSKSCGIGQKKNSAALTTAQAYVKFSFLPSQSHEPISAIQYQ